MPGIRTCTIVEGCESPCEGNTDGCATHNSEKRKAGRLKAKPKKVYRIASRSVTNKPVKKEPITYACSDGTRVSQAEIDRRRSEAYRKKYPVQNMTCHGCWLRGSHGSGHVIAQARCKHIGKTELIWHPDNIFPACLQCNSAIENPKGKNWQKLRDITLMLDFIFEHDQELFQKFRVNGENHPDLKGYFSEKKDI